MAMNKEWDLIIEPKRYWWDLRLNQLWKYRDLIWLFVRRDFVSMYKQTILGPLWFIIQPLLTSLVFTLVFGEIASLPTSGVPDFLFYFSGTVIWGYFSQCLIKTSDTFIINQNIFGKVYFPRLVMPISVVISSMISFVIQFAFLIALIFYFKLRGSDVYPISWVLFLPFIILIMAALGLGFGIIISSLTTKYRDLRFLIQFGVQLWMYATPIIYPVESVPHRYRWIVTVNPVTPIVEIFRYALLGVGEVDYGMLAYCIIFMLIVLMVGIMLFNRIEATFMDTV